MNEPREIVEGERGRIDVKMLELLSCPLTKGPLKWNAATSELFSKASRLAYPVRDGIPILLPSEARPMTDKDEPLG